MGSLGNVQRRNYLYRRASAAGASVEDQASAIQQRCMDGPGSIEDRIKRLDIELEEWAQKKGY